MIDKNFDWIIEQIKLGHLQNAVLSSPWDEGTCAIVKISIRPILVKTQKLFQISSFDSKKVMHRNLSKEKCGEFLKELLSHQFRQATIDLEFFSFHLLINRQKNMKIIQKKRASTELNLLHNQSKKYILPEGMPVPFLVELGIMSSTGQVIAKKYDKFRQINRFIEMVRDIIEDLPKEGTLEVIDFGCGKAYLTFALYHYLVLLNARKVNIVGLDLKPDVIKSCQVLSDKLNYTSLKFALGDINHYQTDVKIDLVISLHACDTATDAAIEKAVAWGAEVILCVPCCQHELNGQIQNPALKSLLKYGILKERFAALVTDAARAELLISQGYDVQILEFIDMEHTPKNLLIRAVKSKASSLTVVANRQKAWKSYLEFKKALNIAPSLENRFYP